MCHEQVPVPLKACQEFNTYLCNCPLKNLKFPSVQCDDSKSFQPGLLAEEKSNCKNSQKANHHSKSLPTKKSFQVLMFLFLSGKNGKVTSKLCGCIQGSCFSGTYQVLLLSTESSLLQIENALNVAKCSANGALTIQQTNGVQSLNLK